MTFYDFQFFSEFVPGDSTPVRLQTRVLSLGFSDFFQNWCLGTMLLSPDSGTVYSHPACVGFRVRVRVKTHVI